MSTKDRPMTVYCVLFLVATSISISESAKVLGLFTTFSRSHLIIHRAVIQTLIDSGHDVTIVTTLPLNEPNKTYRHIHLDVPPIPSEFMTGMIKNTKGPMSMFFSLPGRIDIFMNYSNSALTHPKMKRLMAEDSFELLVFGYFFNAFELGVAAHFKCPIVISLMQRPFRVINSMIGNPHEILYVPHLIVGVGNQRMSFVDRLKNVFAFVMDYGIFSFIDHKTNQYYNKNFPSDKYPPLKELYKNVSLVLSCSHFSNGIVRPDVPALVSIGGIQVKPKPNPLPADLNKFMEGATQHGAIYFSLGSNARSADMNSETIRVVYKVLSSLKQRVVWKWESDTPPGNASNIFFGKWLPQDDILAHKNTKLFITHGGHGSVVESEYHGVPMVGMPLFADQFANMDSVQGAGYGLSIGKDEVTEEKFRWTVEEVLSNPKYRNNVQEFSRVYRDRPMSARDTAAYWLEYVIRHKGAKHMQSPAVHMNFIQYYGLDVFGFLLAIVYVLWKMISFAFRKMLSLCFGRKNKSEEREADRKKKAQ